MRQLARVMSSLAPGRRWLGETPVLTRSDVLDRSESTEESSGLYLAFYSSVLGGIVRDVDLMTVPIDDHFVHRGHAVFDTALVRHGSVYQLDQHLDRLMKSAQGCSLWREAEFLEFFQRERLKGIILDTIQCAKKTDQHIRYWLGAGPGGFGISHEECRQPSFYVISSPYKELEKDVYEKGVKVVTTSVPMKPVPFCNIKTTNYLQNAMTAIEAESKGAYMGVWVNEKGYIAECATSNLGFVIGGVFIVPSFTETLAGISVQRMMYLAETQLKMEVLQRDIAVPIGKAAEEAFLMGGSMGAVPITHWDNQPVGTGSVGPHARALLKLYREDVLHGHGDSHQLISLKGLE